MNDIFVRLRDMPGKIKGLTILDNEGDYNIYINSRLSFESQCEAYHHELAHIERDDLYNALPIDKVENL